MILEVIAVPKSKHFFISPKDGKIKIFLRSPPEKNKANLELVTELWRLIGRPVRLLSGHKSKHKRLDLSVTEAEWAVIVNKFK